MRARGLWSFGLVILLACDGGGKDAGDGGDGGDGGDPAETDGGGTDGGDETDETDDTDGGDDEAAFDTVEPIAPFRTTRFGGVDVVSHVPDDARGVVYVFHGTGGSAEGLADTTEAIAIFNAFIEADLGFFLMESVDRSRAQYEHDLAPASNPDWQNLSGLREALIDEGVLADDLPSFTWGYSAGGSFSSYAAQAGVEAGWPIRGAIYHNSGGRNGHWRGRPDVPALFVTTEHDVKVDPDGVRSAQEDHVAAGNVGELVWIEEAALHPLRFARTRFINKSKSREIGRALFDGGWFDEDGARTFPIEDVDDALTEMIALPGVDPDPPVKAVINVVLATHALNGTHAADEAAFLVDQLP